MIHSHGIQVFYSLMKIENKNEPNNTSSEYTLHGYIQHEEKNNFK